MRLVERWRRIYFLTPTFRPVGGVVKIFDYVNHARGFGLEPVICCPEPFKEDLPLFEISRFSDISPKKGFRFIHQHNSTWEQQCVEKSAREASHPIPLLI